MQRRLSDGVDVADEVSGVGVVPLDVGQQLLDDRVVAPPARLVQGSLAALSGMDQGQCEYLQGIDSMH